MVAGAQGWKLPVCPQPGPVCPQVSCWAASWAQAPSLLVLPYALQALQPSWALASHRLQDIRHVSIFLKRLCFLTHP